MKHIVNSATRGAALLSTLGRVPPVDVNRMRKKQKHRYHHSRPGARGCYTQTAILRARCHHDIEPVSPPFILRERALSEKMSSALELRFLTPVSLPSRLTRTEDKRSLNIITAGRLSRRREESDGGGRSLRGVRASRASVLSPRGCTPAAYQTGPLQF